MGPALKNMESLVQLPTGCGEQNMVKFAPLVSITKYLNKTSQLDSKLEKMAHEFIRKGLN